MIPPWSVESTVNLASKCLWEERVNRWWYPVILALGSWGGRVAGKMAMSSRQSGTDSKAPSQHTNRLDVVIHTCGWGLRQLEEQKFKVFPGYIKIKVSLGYMIFCLLQLLWIGGYKGGWVYPQSRPFRCADSAEPEGAWHQGSCTTLLGPSTHRNQYTVTLQPHKSLTYIGKQDLQVKFTTALL